MSGDHFLAKWDSHLTDMKTTNRRTNEHVVLLKSHDSGFLCCSPGCGSRSCCLRRRLATCRAFASCCCRTGTSTSTAQTCWAGRPCSSQSTTSTKKSVALHSLSEVVSLSVSSSFTLCLKDIPTSSRSCFTRNTPNIKKKKKTFQNKQFPPLWKSLHLHLSACRAWCFGPSIEERKKEKQKHKKKAHV